ncbi:2-C-methyl-D-erythritol 4-phosphate cytidylyltransferase [Anaerococcus lactolyticus]|uniref:2-C-methyl-D-erythritol 4-phosphate cytidylyltransferase n=1 Tax=Anaerococcus lactolyticus S7-1-13 TaxID=1284686 RepID=A0A095ZA58_9FIRM|nr:2-C-methyl-D-erythritol 4-phosphate cytidylyltransferase [Anaerococcus lactolyticus]KGF05314.1 4-diphosphocytidyl-2C-methyl-D-erythritol synthase [Anaerococcus lactolyticus S7-1-13]
MYKGKFLSAVITAAGSGTRMGLEINKPYLEIGSKKILELSLTTVTSIEEFDEIILVIREEDFSLATEILSLFRDPRIKMVAGGASREESTYNGLIALNPDSDLVLSHDGVRPFASRGLFLRVLKEMETYKAAISATKSKDTVKVANENGEVEFTPNREFVYNIQTPQGFDTRLIKSLYKKYFESEAKITDDSQLFEFFDRDEPVKIVEGEYSNIKMTTTEDIIFAKAFIKGER